MSEITGHPEPSSALAGAEVLISGASFAGLATAWWLNRLGCRVMVVEASHALRQGGTAVDIKGDTIGVIARMGLLDAVRAKALPPRSMQFVDADGGTIGEMGAQPASEGEQYEIHRDDLLAILFAAVEHPTEIVFGRSIRQLEDGPDRVAVTFDDGSLRNFALVFGCDGARSNTRRLAFGETQDFSFFMGGYFAIKVVPDTGLLPAEVTQVFSVPGRTAMMNGYHDRADIGVAFRTEGEIAYDYRDRAQQRQMIHDHFDDLGWKVPAVLDHIDADDDFYFDKINQIRMPVWSKGRVALVGDAGYCVSPLAGMGGSMAILGAAGLADALERHGGDYPAAFQDYHDRLSPFVDEIQDRAVSNGMAIMFPTDEAELVERDRRIHAGELDI